MRLDFQIPFPLFDKGATSSAKGMASGLYNNAATETAGPIQTAKTMQATNYANQNRQMGEAEQGYLDVNNELTGMLPTGGMDQGYLNQVNQGYSDFANTGGVSPGQIAMTMRGAIDPVAMNAANLAGAAQRSAAATGGDAGAAIANIQSEVGSQQAEAANQANLGLVNQIQQGKLAGLGGLGGFQSNLASLRQGVTGQQNAVNTGLSNLYGTTSANTNTAGNQVLQGLGLQFGAQANAGNIMQQLSKNPGLFASIMGGLEQAGGAAAGAAMGFNKAGLI